MTKTYNIDKNHCLAAQRVLMDNGIETDETPVVLQTLCAVLLDDDLDNLIEWNENKIPYTKSIWE